MGEGLVPEPSVPTVEKKAGVIGEELFSKSSVSAKLAGASILKKAEVKVSQRSSPIAASQDPNDIRSVRTDQGAIQAHLVRMAGRGLPKPSWNRS